MAATATSTKFQVGDRVTWQRRLDGPISGTVVEITLDEHKAAYRDYDAYEIIFDGYPDFPFGVYAWGLEPEGTK